MIIFGRSVTEKVRNQMLLFVLRYYLAKEETQKTVQHSPTAAVLSTWHSKASFDCLLYW